MPVRAPAPLLIVAAAAAELRGALRQPGLERAGMRQRPGDTAGPRQADGAGAPQRVSGLAGAAPVWVLCAGVGTAGDEPLRGVLDTLSPAALINVGFAGGIDAALVPGSLVIGTCWYTPADAEPVRTPAPEPLLRHVRAALADRGITATEGAGYTVAAPLHDAVAHASIRRRTGAIFVDTESARWARLAAQAGARFATLRVISDRADTRLPRPRHELLSPDGAVRWGTWLGTALRAGGIAGLGDQLARLRRARADWIDACRGLETLTAGLVAALERAPDAPGTTDAAAPRRRPDAPPG